MSEQLKVYRKPNRKAEIVARLELLLKAQNEAAQVLEDKAWTLLQMTSVVVGAISGISLSKESMRENIGSDLGKLLAVILVVYIVQVIAVIKAVWPREWRFVPGEPEGNITYNGLFKRYIASRRDRYFDQLIADYTGGSDANSALGAIQIAQKHNRVKSCNVIIAAVCLGMIVILFGMMAIISVYRGLY